LLPEAYPASITPNTSLERTASMKNAATLRSYPTRSRLKGRAMNPAKAAQNARYGATRNRNLSAASGAVSSLLMSLSTSASDWSSPSGPTRVGPSRSWMRPENFRSSQMKM
jgi:hypothetical protein